MGAKQTSLILLEWPHVVKMYSKKKKRAGRAAEKCDTFVLFSFLISSLDNTQLKYMHGLDE